MSTSRMSLFQELERELDKALSARYKSTDSVEVSKLRRRVGLLERQLDAAEKLILRIDPFFSFKSTPEYQEYGMLRAQEVR